MIKAFLDDNFLLQTETAQNLYHEHAAKLPIIDYHCHLDPKMVAENHKFSSITELWLGGDHYKWRGMRTNGIAEKYITGDASDWEKFEKWAETLPYTFRNPLFHWTQLELKTAFGITKILKPETAREIYEECNDKILHDPSYRARGLMEKYNVEIVCTTDDPVDDLRYHKQYASEKTFTRMIPAWRPDKAIAVENPSAFRDYIERLSDVSGVNISTFQDVIDALQKRHDYFHTNGCRLSDHGMDEFYAEDYTESEINNIFNKVYGGQTLTEIECRKYRSCIFLKMAEMDYESGWAQQFHYGPMRNNNEKMFRLIGPDTGFDSIGQAITARSMAKFFSRLALKDKLTKTIIYNLNPSDNEMVATMIGNFQDDTCPGKMQWGSGWWFMDQKRGMENQMNTLSVLGLLSRFVGMLTDSRSFLSYPRHEYFRRTLCNLLGNDVENGELPYSEIVQIEKMVEDISYYNAKNYFNF